LPEYFLEAYKKCSIEGRPNFYNRLIHGSFSSKNTALAFWILNNKDLVDLLFLNLIELEKAGKNSVKSMRHGIEGSIKYFNLQENFKTTYFFTK